MRHPERSLFRQLRRSKASMDEYALYYCAQFSGISLNMKRRDLSIFARPYSHGPADALWRDPFCRLHCLFGDRGDQSESWSTPRFATARLREPDQLDQKPPYWPGTVMIFPAIVLK